MPVPVEEEIVIEVGRKREIPNIEYVIEEVPVFIDEEVIEYYDVIKENVIEVIKERPVNRVTRIISQRPQFRTEIIEEKIGVQKKIVIPVQGPEIHEGDIEVEDPVLESRTRMNVMNR